MGWRCSYHLMIAATHTSRLIDQAYVLRSCPRVDPLQPSGEMFIPDAHIDEHAGTFTFCGRVQWHGVGHDASPLCNRVAELLHSRLLAGHRIFLALTRLSGGGVSLRNAGPHNAPGYRPARTSGRRHGIHGNGVVLHPILGRTYCPAPSLLLRGRRRHGVQLQRVYLLGTG